MESVNNILTNTRVNGEYHTHVSMINPLGTFQINRNYMESFWDSYCTAIKDDEKNCFGIAEKLQAHFPILVDFDLKLSYTEDKDVTRLYTRSQLESVVRDYQEVIRIIVDNYEYKHSICFVLEKPAYKVVSGDNEYIKSGFHLHFPYVFLSKSDHEVHLIPRVKKMITKSDSFKNLGIQNSGDLIDNSYVKNPWLLYGSKKSENMDSYKLTTIYNEDRDEITLNNALKDYKFYDSDEMEINLREDNYEFYLPRILSVVPWFRQITELKSNLQPLIKISSGLNQKKDYVVKNMTEILEKASKLLSIMSDTRVSDYSNWMHIGWALYNISNGGENGLALWLNFSSRCKEKFKESDCISLWDKMVRGDPPMTIGTLHYFAKQDNALEYAKIINSYSDEYIKQSLEGSHTDLAKACYERFGTEFVCASISQNTWYQYSNHRWKKIEEGIFLRQKLSEDIVKIFENKKSEMHLKISKSNSEPDKNMYNLQIKQIQKMINSLKSTPFKTNVMKECKDVFYDEKFLKNIDKNKWLIGFRNGVYDLSKNCFREGVPEDYISLQMPIDYSEYTNDDKMVQEVNDFLTKIFPDKNVRDYFLDISSEVFIGGNQHKHVYFWSGEGDNGKSITQMFFEKMLGEYAVKLPTSLIVGKRTQSSAACPELVRAGNGVRWAILQEPDKKDNINIGILKELSGNDSFFARGLFQAGGEIEPMFKLTVICNDPPTISYSDKATWNRIRVIPFESTFTDKSPETWEEQLRQKKFPKDPHFHEKIPHMLKPFVWVLLDHRKKGIVKLVEPEKVKLATDHYRKKNDSYQQFVDECIIMDKKSGINLQDLYARFKDWFKEGFPGQTLPTKSEVKEYYTKVWGDQVRTFWRGKRLSTFEDESKFENDENDEDDEDNEDNEDNDEKEKNKKKNKKNLLEYDL
jgi:P4 family phage/plasmid primase-like protien